MIVLAQEMADVVTITLNDYEAGREVGLRIGQTHHQAVCLLGVSETDKAVGITRKQGILDGLQETGLSRIDFLETDFSFATSRQVVREYLKTHRPDCLICATDNLALAAFKELHSAGLRIPQDVSLSLIHISALRLRELDSIGFYNPGSRNPDAYPDGNRNESAAGRPGTSAPASIRGYTAGPK